MKTSTAVAVMFTFSFGSAFAVTGQTYNYTQASDLVTKTVDDLLLAAQNSMNNAVTSYTDATVSVGSTPVTINKTAAKALFQDMYDEYYNALTAAAKAQQQALADAWNLDNNATFVDGSSILDTDALRNVAKPTYTVASAGVRAAIEAQFEAVQTSQKEDLEKISTTKYADTKPAGSNKTYAQIAQDEIVKALSQVLGYKVYSTTTDADIVKYIGYMQAVYTAPEGTGDASGALAVGGTVDNVVYRAGGLNALKTATVVVTDDAKIEYAKKRALAVAEQVISGKKAELIKAEEDKIFKQQVSSNPSQKAINEAKKNIDMITKQYDALLKVWTYRLNNADYKVERAANSADTNEYVYAYYDDARYNKVQRSSLAVAYYAANELKDYGVYLSQQIGDFTDLLSLKDAVALVEHADDLTEQADLLKASVAVDGNTAVAIDEALADAIEDTYMNGNEKAALDTTTVNYETHKRVHALLGDTCLHNDVLDASKKEVKIDGKTYDTVLTWADAAAYDKTKLKEVKAIVKDAKAALKAAKTVAEADAAFLAAYEKFDAVMTVLEHNALFTYGGALYDAYPKAVAEIKAYIDYKASLMADTYPGTTVNTLKTYFEKQLKDDSYSAEDLAANLAAAKTTVDTLKTKAELTTEEAALYKEVLKVADPVKLADKDAVVDLYKRVMTFNDYAEMVGFTGKTAAVPRINKAVIQLAGLEEDEIDAIADVIEKDYKVTLEDKENVEKFLAAIKAYNNLYVDELKVVTNYNTTPYTYLAKLTDSKDYEGTIFALEVKEAEKLIAALPSEGATVAQLKAARDAVDALGFEGICKLNRTLVTKLNRLDQNSDNSVEALKITARSSAKKGSITVKWTVKGDASVADGYQVWKSTKQSKGYKKAITTTKKSYKNTKGLKKGTRYYYKVRAYKVVDGKKVYSDWSNKAYRVAK